MAVSDPPPYTGAEMQLVPVYLLPSQGGLLHHSGIQQQGLSYQGGMQQQGLSYEAIQPPTHSMAMNMKPVNPQMVASNITTPPVAATHHNQQIFLAQNLSQNQQTNEEIEEERDKAKSKATRDELCCTGLCVVGVLEILGGIALIAIGLATMPFFCVAMVTWPAGAAMIAAGAATMTGGEVARRSAKKKKKKAKEQNRTQPTVLYSISPSENTTAVTATAVSMTPVNQGANNMTYNMGQPNYQEQV
ncbi:uncharacterized protein LOC108950393 isoform X2 [Ciona intestinalis]